MTTATLRPHQLQELDLSLERERRWLIENIGVLEALQAGPWDGPVACASDETRTEDWEHREIWTQQGVPTQSYLADAIAMERAPAVARVMLDDLYRESLGEVEDALSRLDRGTYGVCEQCGGAIYPPRLTRIPWARYCRRCAVRPVTEGTDGGAQLSTAEVADAVRGYRIVKALLD